MFKDHLTGRQLGGVSLFLLCVFSSINSLFDHLLESSHRDDSKKWSNIGFGEEITHVDLIEVHFTHLSNC